MRDSGGRACGTGVGVVEVASVVGVGSAAAVGDLHELIDATDHSKLYGGARGLLLVEQYVADDLRHHM